MIRSPSAGYHPVWNPPTQVSFDLKKYADRYGTVFTGSTLHELKSLLEGCLESNDWRGVPTGRALKIDFRHRRSGDSRLANCRARTRSWLASSLGANRRFRFSLDDSKISTTWAPRDQESAVPPTGTLWAPALKKVTVGAGAAPFTYELVGSAVCL
jgi:hypothetical protein